MPEEDEEYWGVKMSSAGGRISVIQHHAIHRASNELISLMRMKLMENGDKGLWYNETYAYLRSRIDDELKELDEAIANGKHIDARTECADVANFLMMINDNLAYGRFKELEVKR